MLIELTNSLIEAGSSSNCGYNWDQFKILGIPTPPVKGWKNNIIGKSIYSETFSLFLKLKGLKPKQRKMYKEEIDRICKREYGE